MSSHAETQGRYRTMYSTNDFKRAQKIDDQAMYGPYKTIRRRILAAFIDSAILTTLFSIINLSLYFLIGQKGMAVTIVIWPISAIIYNVYMVKKYGGSLGKLLSGLKVLSFDKEELDISWIQSIRRELINIFNSSITTYKVIFFFTVYQAFSYTIYRELGKEHNFIGFLTMISMIIGYIEIFSSLLNKKRRALHDYIGNTVVKKVSSVNKITVIMGVVSFIMSFWIYGRVLRLFY